MYEMSDEIKLQILSYIEQIKNGVKPIAFMPLQTRYISQLKQLVSEAKIKLYVEEISEDENWKTVYLYKHEYLIDIIKNLPRTPQTPYDHWVIGKACGYSDDSIGEFIKSNPS